MGRQTRKLPPYLNPPPDRKEKIVLFNKLLGGIQFVKSVCSVRELQYQYILCSGKLNIIGQTNILFLILPHTNGLDKKD